MINVPDEIKQLLKQDSVRKNFRVSFPNGEHSDLTNSQILRESVEFTESLCSQDSLKFGLCEASVISFEAFDVGYIKDMMIECSLEIDCSDLDDEFIAEYCTIPQDLGYPIFSISYGQFLVDSCLKDKSGRQRRRITAYSTDSFAVITPKAIYTYYSDNDRFDVLPATITDTSETSDTITKHLNVLSNIFAAKGIEPSGTVYQAVLQSHDVPYPYSYIQMSSSSGIDYYFDIRYSRMAGVFKNQLGFTIECDKTCVARIRRLRLQEGCLETLNETLDELSDAMYAHYTLPRLGAHRIQECVDFLLKYFNIPIETEGTVLDGTLRAHFTGDYVYPLRYKYNPEVTFLYQEPVVISASASLGDLCTEITMEVLDSNNVIATATFSIELQDTLSFDYIVSDFPRVDYSVTYQRRNASSNYFDAQNRISLNVFRNDCRDLTQGIAESLGMFFKFDRMTHKLHMLDIDVDLATTVPAAYESRLFEISMSMYKSLWYDDIPNKKYSAISCAYVNANGNQATASYTIVNLQDVDNPKDYQEYEIPDNDFIKLAKRTSQEVTSILSAMASHIDNVNYIPSDVDCVGLPYVEVGDIAQVTTSEGTFKTFILRRTLSGIQALSDNFESK